MSYLELAKTPLIGDGQTLLLISSGGDNSSMFFEIQKSRSTIQSLVGKGSNSLVPHSWKCREQIFFFNDLATCIGTWRSMHQCGFPPLV